MTLLYKTAVLLHGPSEQRQNYQLQFQLNYRPRQGHSVDFQHKTVASCIDSSSQVVLAVFLQTLKRVKDKDKVTSDQPAEQKMTVSIALNSCGGSTQQQSFMYTQALCYLRTLSAAKLKKTIATALIFSLYKWLGVMYNIPCNKCDYMMR